MRRSCLSLLLCLTLAVHLFATAVSAHPLFIEICEGHRTVLVPPPDSPEYAECETCLACCALAISVPQGERSGLTVSTAALVLSVQGHIGDASAPRRLARAPPVLMI